MSIIRWQIYCNTEGKWVQGLSDLTDGPPTVCFNDPKHIVNPDSQQELEGTQILNVKVLQEDIPTGGHYTTEGYIMTIPPFSTEILPVSWPMKTTCTLVHLMSMPENLDDIVNAVVNPHTIIGGITSNIDTNSVTAYVSVTVIANIKIGFECYIGSEHLGRVLNVDTIKSEITFEYPTTISHKAGEYVFTEMKIIRNLYLGATNGYDLGLSSVGGKYLKENTVTNIIYTNNSDVEKKFRFSVEYLF